MAPTAFGEIDVELWIFIFLVVSWRNVGALQSEPSAIIPYETNTISESAIVGIPTVKEVSAMCSNVGGIHASVTFDRPFSGRIYSLGYGQVHECIYFNGFYAKSVLFSIPIDGCGTRLTKNTRQVVDMLENRVYVQMDKYTLTAFDRKYAFVCELAPTKSNAPNDATELTETFLQNSGGWAPNGALSEVREIRRRPIAPSVKFTPTMKTGALTSSAASAEIESATPLTPIIPQNAPRGVTPMMPALLYYGNRQWRVPAENVNFKRPSKTNKAASAQENVPEHPTVIVPIEDRTGEIANPFAPDFTDFQARLTASPDDLYWNKISTVPDSDLLNFNGLESKTIRTTAATRTVNEKSVSTTTKATVVEDDLQRRGNTAGKQLAASAMPVDFADAKTTKSTNDFFTTPGIVSQQNLSLNPPNKPRTFVAGSSTSESSSTSDVEKSIFLEIRRNAESPTKSGGRVEGSVKIGEPIMLVVHAQSASKDPKRFDIFVHSCYSSGGSNLTKIQLIDNAGCAVHPQVISGMKRERISLPPSSSFDDDGSSAGSEVVYYFSMRAFKFPVGDDVHFFCSVDISSDYDFPELCPAQTTHLTVLSRLARWIPPDKAVDENVMRQRKNIEELVNLPIQNKMEEFVDHPLHQASHVIHGLKVSNVTLVADDAKAYEEIKGNVDISATDTISDIVVKTIIVTSSIIIALIILVAIIFLILLFISFIRRCVGDFVAENDAKQLRR